MPTLSQMAHVGDYPAYGSGGEAWCSPTSTAMVLATGGPVRRRPTRVGARRPPGTPTRVDHAARHTFDHRYDGTGNWPFNTAYAGRYGHEAFVTRLAT